MHFLHYSDNAGFGKGNTTLLLLKNKPAIFSVTIS